MAQNIGAPRVSSALFSSFALHQRVPTCDAVDTSLSRYSAMILITYDNIYQP